jgi:hypothetical protein
MIHRRTALLLMLPTGLLVGGAIALSAADGATAGPAPATHTSAHTSAPPSGYPSATAAVATAPASAPSVVVTPPASAPNPQPTCVDAQHPVATGVLPPAGLPTCPPSH